MNNYVHCTRSIKALVSLAEGGRLISALEGADTNSYSYCGLNDRKKIEPLLFGGHPVYASLTSSEEDEEFGYGPIRIGINPNKVVATGTKHDTLRLFDIAYESTRWKPNVTNAMNYAIKAVRNSIIADPRLSDPSCCAKSYEIQIHSPVTIDCIDWIDFGGQEIPLDVWGALVNKIELINFWIKGSSPESWAEKLSAKHREKTEKSVRTQTLKSVMSQQAHLPTGWTYIEYEGRDFCNHASLYAHGKLIYHGREINVHEIIKALFHKEKGLMISSNV